MRIIKVRAWDEDAEHMFYSDKPEDDYFFEFMDGNLRGFAIRPPRGSDNPMEPPEPYVDDFPIMQFTGFIVENREIYEKDIVKFNGGAEDFFAEIGFEDGCFIAKMPWIAEGKKYPELKYYMDMKFVSAKVVGTMDENPELLEKENEPKT